MNPFALSLLVCAYILVVQFIAQRWVPLKEDSEGEKMAESAAFTLLGLLIAFTLSSAADRLNLRRTEAIIEANSISTAILRADLIESGNRSDYKRLLQDYIRSRISFNLALEGEGSSEAATLRSQKIQADIWQLAIRHTGPEAKLLVLPSLNEAFDAALTRHVLAKNSTPLPIYILIFLLAGLTGIIIGKADLKSNRPGWWPRLLYSVLIAASIFVISDMDNPRSGFIRLQAADQELESLLEPKDR